MKTANTIHTTNDLTLGQAAKLAGFGLLLMFLFGAFASGPDATQNIHEFNNASFRFRAKITCDLMMLVFDVIAAAGLYAFLKPVNKTFSQLAAWFRLAHVTIYSAALISMFLVIYLQNEASTLSGLSKDQIDNLSILLLQGQNSGFLIGLLFFGFHFFFVGYLIMKSTYVPKIIGIFWLIVAIGYVSNSLLNFVHPSFEAYKSTAQLIVFIPAIVAELSFCLWLLLKGSKLECLVGKKVK